MKLILPRPDLDADPSDPFLLQHQLEDAYMLYRKCFQGNSLRINIVCEFYILFLIIKVLFFQCQVLPQTLSNNKNASGISDRRCINSSICVLAACATRLFIFRQSHAKYSQNTHCGKLHPVKPSGSLISAQYMEIANTGPITSMKISSDESRNLVHFI